ncbi:unnamed protein product [[Candida] boidinii]|nr:unnamed protein product [[Candida] boidinii]
MKFSHSLQFNSVPEWSSKYIAYSTLKKQIYTLQRNALQQQKSKGTVVDDAEHQFLSSEEVNHEASQAFISLLDKELKKIDKFYKLKETEIFGDFDDLIDQIEEFENKFVGDDSISEQESRKTLKDLIEAIKKSESTSRRSLGNDVPVGNNSQILETDNNNVVTHFVTPTPTLAMINSLIKRQLESNQEKMILQMKTESHPSMDHQLDKTHKI